MQTRLCSKQVLRTQIAKLIKYKNDQYNIVKAVRAPTWGSNHFMDDLKRLVALCT